MHYYTRQECCALAAIDDERFKTLARRGQLPVEERKRAATPRIGSFSDVDVLTIAAGEALRVQIGNDKGLSAESAMLIASFAREIIGEFFQTRGAGEIWIGTLASRVSQWDRARRTKTGWFVSGTLNQIADQIADARSHCDTLRMFAVNLRAVIDEVRARARAARIYFPGPQDV